ncbi:hypothetical protein AMJ52_04740 [candidate division TA06 bacterium DG_78]|uniref:Uncharacterized protein n=1 Tax=candidate division TA06 bacterium DG_78 TaxID=1703772 RepID=A0A0S7YDV7_UNCT6|nr:MAG: hypothetical protein AMJ52_04740 [candidate division TA06 bacterium DG_78]
MISSISGFFFLSNSSSISPTISSIKSSTVIIPDTPPNSSITTPNESLRRCNSRKTSKAGRSSYTKCGNRTNSTTGYSWNPFQNEIISLM